MTPRKMTSKKASTCTRCGKEIRPGQMIYWERGVGAWHVNCETASLQDSVCPACSGRGCSWNGVPCKLCDGTGSRKVADFAKSGGHKQDHSGQEDRCCGDAAYEDSCARACGF